MAPPRTGTTQIQVRFPPALLAAVDASIAEQSPRLSRPKRSAGWSKSDWRASLLRLRLRRQRILPNSGGN
jgi:hypothetical protein